MQPYWRESRQTQSDMLLFPHVEPGNYHFMMDFGIFLLPS